MVRVLSILALVTLAGCAIEPSYRAQAVRPAYPEMVTECVFLGGVTSTSDLVYTELGMQRAKYKALDEAAQLGATHIVWVDLSKAVQPTAKGRAYRCDPDQFGQGSRDYHYPDGDPHDYGLYDESAAREEIFYGK